MIAKIAGLAVALTLVGATVALAGPPAKEVDDANEVALSQAAVPLYFPTSGATSILQPDSRDNNQPAGY